MGLWSDLLSKRRIREVSRKLAAEPSARNYVVLAQEHARLGRIRDVLRICEEGLESYPGNLELKRLLERAREIQREGRLRELQNDLKHSPRPALWRELCQLHLSSARYRRAEDCASEWYATTHDGEAAYWRAEARVRLYFADRHIEDGRTAFSLTEEAGELMRDDARPLRLRLELASRVGAWREARKALARLLELQPGDPELEARFRTVMTLSEKRSSIEDVLRDVEVSGEFVDDKPRRQRVGGVVTVRPMLQELAEEPHVQASFYVRGGTALVQGARGVQAERSARALRELLQSTRNASRRLGLGQPIELEVEGDFGFLYCVPGELGSSAIWSKRPVVARQVAKCRELAGMLDTEEHA